MKKLLSILMLLLMAVPVFAYLDQQGFSKDMTSTDINGTECNSFNSSQSYCRVFQDVLTISYMNSPRLYLGTIQRAMSDNIGNNKYVAYIRVSVENFSIQGRFFNRVNKTSEFCEVYDNTLNATPRVIIYNQTQYGNRTYDDFIRVELLDNQYVRCLFNTFYVNRTLMLTNSPIQWKIWKPSYKSTTQQPCKLTLLKKEAQLETCQEDTIGSAISDKEYVKFSIKKFIYNVFILLQYIFWIFILAILILVIEIIFIAPFLLIRIGRMLIKKLKRR
jgi:hypothetical protein